MFDVDGSATLYAVSCPTISLYAAVDTSGNIVTSTDPTGGVAAWHVTKVDPNSIYNVSCASVKLCVHYRLPRQVAQRELAVPFRFYLGVTRGSSNPPKILFLDNHVKIKTSHLSGEKYSTRFTFTVDVGRGLWDWDAEVCQKDIEATDGFNLPGHFPCGAKKVSVNTYIPALTPGREEGLPGGAYSTGDEVLVLDGHRHR